MRKISITMKINVLAIILIFTGMTIYGQINPNTLLPNVSPPNPQAYQFMKYGEIPVNKYTGVPEISIPIYNIETKGLNIPIALTYHSNGIKVNEEASWVGLGWNLNTDMEVVQIVVGLDDFGYYKNRTLPDFGCMISGQAGGLSGTGVMSTCGTFFLGYDTDWNRTHPNCYLYPYYEAGTKDTEPDVFYFNMLGYSGKFTLNWNTGQFICMTDKNIKIQSDIDGLNNNDYGTPINFAITVPDGNRFQFRLKDQTKINVSYTASSEGGTTPSNVAVVNEKSSRVYKLINISTIKNDVIDFDYENVETSINGSITNAVSKNFPSINVADKNYVPDSGTGSNTIPSTAGYLTSYTATEQTYSYLKKIIYNDETIEFISTLREDLKEGKKLDKIVVKYKGNIVKSFVFNYDYFISNNLGYNWDSFLTYNNYTVNKTEAEITKRLKLLSFNDFSEKPYVFDYNTQSLPRKTSYATDYWGFYNGVNTNNSFFPDIYKFNIERGNEHYYYLRNNNNTPVLQYSLASTLNNITYPTGGKSIFEYELNSFNNFQAPTFNQGLPTAIGLSTVAMNNRPTQEAVLIEGGNTIFKISGLLSTAGCFPQYPEAYSSCYFRATYFKKELISYIKNNALLNSHLNSYGLKYVLGADLDFLDGNPSNLSLYNQFKGAIFGEYSGNIFTVTKTANVITDEFINKTLNIKEGIVIFDVNGGCGTYSPTLNNNWSQSSFSISYNDYKPLLAGESYGAGLRIKTVTSLAASGSRIPYSFKKIYDYQGGKLMSPLLYFNKTRMSSSMDKIIVVIDNSNLQYNNSIPLYRFETIRKSYYSNQSQSSARFIEQSLLEFCILCEAIITTDIFIGVKNELHSGSYIQPSSSASGKYVGYDKVTERYIDENTGTTPAGKGTEISYYTNNPDLGSTWNPSGGGGGIYTEINLPLVNVYPENGKIIQNEIYNQNSELKKQTFNSYFFSEEPCFFGMKMINTGVNIVYTSTLGLNPTSKYLIGVYPIKRGTSVLKKSVTKSFEQGNEIATQKDFIYDTNNQISKILETNSKQEIVETNVKYPYDFTSAFPGMIARNMINPVIEKITKVNDVPISLTRTDYKFINTSNPAYYFQNQYAIDKIKFSKSGTYNDIEDAVLFHNYDEYTNPVEVSKKDGTRVSYIWGYNGKYPVAKIENASWPTGDNQTLGLDIISPTLITAIRNTSNTGIEANLILSLNALRTSLPNAIITTYTYKPLIGVSTITDPKGDKMTYNYDQFNRLLNVTDKFGNILTENQYNYKQ